MIQTIYKWLLLPLILLMVAPSLLFADENKVLETQNEKESYSIGYQVGLSIKSDGVDVDSVKFMQGLQDAVAGKEGLLSNDEMRSLIVALKERAREERMQEVLEIRAKNAEESATFLEENANKEGVKTTESGLQYMIINEGEGDPPKPGDMVTVHYRGTFTDGEEFDSSYARGEPQTFQTDGVIRGWTEALQLMKVGSKWKIFVPPDLAYGRGGLGHKIPPNKVLVFEMELLSVEKNQEKEG